MIEVSPNTRQIARVVLLGCVAGMVAGCGWTPRDEFYLNRSVVLAPELGDGSQISSTVQRQSIPTADAPQVVQSPSAPGRPEAQ